MSSERAGTPTRGHLDRADALGVLYAVERDGMDKSLALDALEACVVPDHRLGRIEALCDEADRNRPNAIASHVVFTKLLRAVLRGDE